MHQDNHINSVMFICFDWTVRILNHRGFCARLVRNFCVPDTVTNIGFLKQINKTQTVISIQPYTTIEL